MRENQIVDDYPEVRRRPNEDIESLIKRFNRRVQADRTMQKQDIDSDRKRHRR